MSLGDRPPLRSLKIEQKVSMKVVRIGSIQVELKKDKIKNNIIRQKLIKTELGNKESN